MMHLAKRSCIRCGAMIEHGWYFNKCQPAPAEQVPNERFKGLKTDPVLRKFYGKAKWKQTSKRFLINHPLCETCLKDHKYVASGVTHHIPEVSIILEKGGDPYDEKYLHAICRSCHQVELNKKRYKK